MSQVLIANLSILKKKVKASPRKVQSSIVLMIQEVTELHSIRPVTPLQVRQGPN